MDNRFSAALRAAIAGSGRSLDSLAKELSRRGTPVSVSALSNWQTGVNHPERGSSIAALTGLEETLRLPPRALTVLLPDRRPRGRWQPRDEAPAPHRWMWRDPRAVTRLLAKLDATPEDLYRPARMSRQVKQTIDEHGYECEDLRREIIQGGRGGSWRVILVLRCQSLPRPPTLRPVEGCHLGRFRAETTHSLCAFELLLDEPLLAGELALIEFALRLPPRQAENHHNLRIQSGVRDLVLQTSFHPSRQPARCAAFHQPASGGPTQTLAERAGTGGNPVFRIVLADPAPGIYGIRWTWPEPGSEH
ncbi:XRE family transcriptional regulator [Amycolatopsis aidingensis]|uniref:XRE family transcriptional regulator n=1 Tax=Amycolatopsis aidingensis TaxID=2842453 RepID=UPI001C0E3879|nr:XRE family transcriptional regulator [Amycolatopsis aidingensis]